MSQATIVHQVSIGTIRVSVATSRRPLRNMLTIERRASGSSSGWYPAATYPPEEASDLIGAVNMAVAWIKREAGNSGRGTSAANSNSTSDDESEADSDPERTSGDSGDDTAPPKNEPTADEQEKTTTSTTEPPFTPTTARPVISPGKNSPCMADRKPLKRGEKEKPESSPRCDPERTRSKTKKPPASRSATLARKSRVGSQGRSR
jgi:hypothetical protein